MSKLKNPESIKKFQVGVAQVLELDATQDFMGELLGELNEGMKKTDLGQDSSISFVGEIELFDGKYEEFIRVVGTVNATYYTHDILTNEVMLDSLEAEVKCLALTNEVIQKLQMEDEIDIEFNGEEHDLYFLDADDCIDLKSILHEYVFLNKNNYPKIATD